ncbi:hypothetical protein PN419_00195 [Halorubrum ezzemoulense]|uniref:hypothetical protein n=1 Tax=Halorubrum ezzemoulense TaxID=337243 RepID=UPI00232F4296|nr:hypothetical protein [Halorubrum ezzemoulense]MDB9247426.1 hypothetical protein [Halorubrum ezzemoulense]MDB9258665.1 hypothetical protein [Halorubrum ezzemoulense]MDB9264477.1 hypothetical protein [Halorubrum ezzemoulense]MDB9269026.1 hypothetical protein [Halorubrum ezzemoulense]MDB9271445.1 hypothetical protein [Halorubrum ezzemoulense]
MIVDHIIVSTVGGVIGVVGLFALVVVIMVRSFYDRIIWEDDTPLYGKVSATLRSGARYTYHETDWRTVVKAAPYAFGLLFVVTWLGSLLYVGFTHVYL